MKPKFKGSIFKWIWTRQCTKMCKRVLVAVILICLVETVVAMPPTVQSNFLCNAYKDLKRQIEACAGQYVCDIVTFDRGLFGNQVTCVQKNEICNGQPACARGIDEADCRPDCGDRINCEDGKNCATACDQAGECTGREDENHCPQSCRCPAGSFRCMDGYTCLPRSSLCNGRRECPMGEDEFQCPNGQCDCRPGQFRCGDGTTCVNKMALCNGVQNECPDNSDETGCPLGCSCSPNELLCLNGERCVPRASVCAFPAAECCLDVLADCPGELNEDDGCI